MVRIAASPSTERHDPVAVGECLDGRRPVEQLDGRQPSDKQIALFTSAYPHVVGVCVDVVQLVYKAAGGGAVYQKGPLDRCLRDVLTMNQHVIGTLRTYEMAGRLLLGLQPLRWLF